MNNIVGLEIIGDLKNCSQRELNILTTKNLKDRVSKLIKKYDLTELGSYYHSFNIGLTGVIALAESHVAVHTWPKKKYVSISIYVCNYTKDNSKKAQNLFNDLTLIFKPIVIDKKEIIRSFI